jgi:hypothetical protein
MLIHGDRCQKQGREWIPYAAGNVPGVYFVSATEPQNSYSPIATLLVLTLSYEKGGSGAIGHQRLDGNHR